MFVRFPLNHKSSTHRRKTGPDGPSSDGEFPSGAAFEARVRLANRRGRRRCRPAGRDPRHGSRRRPPPRRRSPSSRSDRSESTPAKHSFVAEAVARFGATSERKQSLRSIEGRRLCIGRPGVGSWEPSCSGSSVTMASSGGEHGASAASGCSGNGRPPARSAAVRSSASSWPRPDRARCRWCGCRGAPLPGGSP